jgi:hypothetical protein
MLALAILLLILVLIGMGLGLKFRVFILPPVIVGWTFVLILLPAHLSIAVWMTGVACLIVGYLIVAVADDHFIRHHSRLVSKKN